MPRNAPKRHSPGGPEVVTIYCDGASLGNPGPAGAGFVLYGPDGEVLTSRAVPLGEMTNNVAEYRALIAALHEAAALRARKVRVKTDSELLVKQMRGEYKVAAAHLKPLHAWARKLLKRFEEVRFEAIPREENAEADQLAKTAAEKARQAP